MKDINASELARSLGWEVYSRNYMHLLILLNYMDLPLALELILIHGDN